MLHASRIIDLWSSRCISELTPPTFFHLWVLRWGRYNAPKFERFRWKKFLSLVYCSLLDFFFVAQISDLKRLNESALMKRIFQSHSVTISTIEWYAWHCHLRTSKDKGSWFISKLGLLNRLQFWQFLDRILKYFGDMFCKGIWCND